jgi:3,4-dihydroxy 2-butanone 4-phosphate synthase/GTP cyclohydrolase II
MSVSISPVAEIVADMRAGKMVILVDEEDRENEGDLVLAADFVTILPARMSATISATGEMLTLMLVPSACNDAHWLTMRST